MGCAGRARIPPETVDIGDSDTKLSSCCDVTRSRPTWDASARLEFWMGRGAEVGAGACLTELLLAARTKSRRGTSLAFVDQHVANE